MKNNKKRNEKIIKIKKEWNKKEKYRIKQKINNEINIFLYIIKYGRR